MAGACGLDGVWLLPDPASSGTTRHRGGTTEASAPVGATWGGVPHGKRFMCIFDLDEGWK